MNRKFLEFLRRRVGPARTLHVTYLFTQYAGLILTGLVFLAASAALVIYYRPEPHRHVAYEPATLNSILPVPSDSGRQKVLIGLVLSDGTEMQLLTLPSLITGALDTVCVEKRRYLITGGYRYRAMPLQLCNL